MLATDGVWDVMDNEEACSLAAAAKPDVSCKEIVEACARRWDTQMPGRRDDITTVVVDLTHPDMCVAPFISAWGEGGVAGGGGGQAQVGGPPQIGGGRRQ